MNHQKSAINSSKIVLDYNVKEFLLAFFMLFIVHATTAQPIHHTEAISSKSDAVSIIEAVRTTNPELADQLYQIYDATKKYNDIDLALADGYIRDPMNICEEAPMMGLPAFMGNMGVHFLHPDLLKITGDTPRINGEGIHTDFFRPGILIYEPQHDGSMKLVAIENLVFTEAWYNAGNEVRPSFMGYDYFFMINNPLTQADEAHMFEPHYDLHMWLYRENPHGLFSPFNPAVTCEHHVGEMKGH